VGVSTLHSLARGAVAAAGDGGGAGGERSHVMAVIDARRKEVFAAGWAAADAARADAAPVFGARALAPEALAEAMAADGRAWLAVGDGAVGFRALLEHAGARTAEPDSELHRVSAVEHCRLATALRPASPEAIQPEYLRLPDAEISLRTARQQ
jgi:tRNA threonylcarbamoyladenosine biosynthesis protein TsaB